LVADERYRGELVKAKRDWGKLVVVEAKIDWWKFVAAERDQGKLMAANRE